MSETYTSLCSKTTLVMVGEQPDAVEKNEPGQVEEPKLQKIGNFDGPVEEVSNINQAKQLKDQHR